MNAPNSLVRLFALFSVAFALTGSREAAAVNLKTDVLPIYQVGVGAGVSLGHVVDGFTNYNRITAGGTYIAACASPLMLPAPGGRTLSAENLVGGLRLITTIPQWLPAIVNMPGYNDLPAGTIVNCTYNWTSRAVESGYSIGAGGVSFQTGNGERADSGTQLFIMIVPGVSEDKRDGGTCIP